MRHDPLAVRRQFRDPPPRAVRRPHLLPRLINIAWLSMGRDDLLEGELVFNSAENTLVYRKGDNTIYRYVPYDSRTI